MLFLSFANFDDLLKFLAPFVQVPFFRHSVRRGAFGCHICRLGWTLQTREQSRLFCWEERRWWWMCCKYGKYENMGKGLSTYECRQTCSCYYQSLWRFFKLNSLIQSYKFLDFSSNMQILTLKWSLDEHAVQIREMNIQSKIERSSEPGVFFCSVCMFQAPSRSKVFCHVESKHFRDSSVVYHCEFCEKVLHSKNALGTHVSRHHRQEKKSQESTPATIKP